MNEQKPSYKFLSGGGEMGNLIREKDWSSTPLGHPDTWPESLRTMVTVMLNNPFGMYIAWGKEFTQIYNDGYRPILGETKHPQALGISTRETFAEVWHIIEPMFEGVMKGEPVGFPDFMMPLNRNGFIEECYFDFTYSPIRKFDGDVGGVLVTVIETTSKKKALEDLKESEERFRTMAEGTDIFIAVGDETGEAIFFNKAWTDLTGRKIEELTKFGWVDLLHPQDKDAFLKIYRDAFEKRLPFKEEFRILNAHGEYRWLLVQGPPRFRTDGNFAGYISSGVDITDRKSGEKELQESKDQLQYAIEAAELGTFDFNPITKKYTVNDRLKQWLGLPSISLHTFQNVFTPVAEEDKERVTEALQNTMDYEKGGILDIKYKMVHPVSRQEMFMHAWGKASFNEQEIACRVNGTLEDITEETLSRNKIEESEQIIRNLVENSPLGICVINAKTLHCEIINNRFVEISGKSVDEVIGNHYWECFSESRSVYEASLDEVIETGIPFYAHEVEFKVNINETEENKYATFVFSPLKDKEGTVQKVAIWEIDNTLQVLARNKIKESESNLKLMILQAPVAIAILRGENYEVEIANKYSLEMWGRREIDVLNKPILESMPELIPQGMKEILDEVWTTGNRFSTFEMPINLLRGNALSNFYVNFSYEPLLDNDGQINGIMAIGVDISQQVIARQKVEDSEQAMRTLVENAPFPIGVFTGKEMMITLANQSIIDAWGKGNNVIGKSYKEILPEFESQKVFDILDKVYLTGIPFHAVNQEIILKNYGESQTHYYNYSFTPLFTATGEVYGVMNTAAEVTELNEAKQSVEAALAEMKLFKYMADNAADPFILMKEDGSFKYLNKIAIEKLGYDEEEVYGLKVTDVDPVYNDKQYRRLFERLDAQNISPFETFHRNKEGQVFPMEISMSKVEFESNPLYFAIARDIDERKKAENDIVEALRKAEESEKRFRESVQQAPLGICVLRGSEFIIEIANENYLLITDRKEDELISKPLFEAIPETRESIESILQEILKTGIPYYGNEFPVSLKRMGKVTTVFFNFVYHPLREVDGAISGIMVVAIDVTSTVQAKRLLEESEKHFRTMIIQSPVSMTILRGPDFIIETANKVLLEKIWRKSEAAVLGKSIFEAFPELKNQKYYDLLNKVLTTGKTHNEKESLAYVDGDDGVKKFYLDFEYAPLLESDANQEGIMITVNDVTDKVDARQKVEEAAERLRLATDATGIATWDLDLQSRQIIHSPQMAKIFGHPESTKLTHAQLRSQIHPDDVALVERVFEEGMKTGIYKYESRIVKPDKSINWIRTRGRIFYDEKEMPFKMLGTLHDITEEKQFQQILQESESKFRLLANSLSEQIWTANPEGHLNYFNKTVLDFSGLTHEELVVDGWLEMVHPDDREKNLDVWIKSISTGKPFLFEHRFKRHDGEYRWQLSRALPQKDDSGKIQMWVGSSTDIQEIKEQEQEKDFFISMASHELKTPLTSIKGYVQMLQMKNEKSDDIFLKSSLKIIDKQIITLTKLISELLDVSKIKTGTLDFNLEHFELQDLIYEVVDEVKYINPNYQIEVEANEKVTIHGDRTRISQVMINLLNNAVKYSPGSDLIKLRCRIKNDSVSVSVEDFGIGIAKKDQEKIFERFYRVEGKNEKTFPGFGIGLYIISDIIKKHQGKIKVESEIGKGTTFTFELPLP